MKYLTYQNQMILGIIGLGVGHFLFWITDYAFFVNLGWIFYGVLFVVHPVWNARANCCPNIKKYVRISGIAVIFIGLVLCAGSGDDFWYDRISEALEVDVSDGVILESYDDHSGFHGDGTMYAVLEFSDDAFEQAISNSSGWHMLPLTDNLEILVYGIRNPEAAIGPFIGTTMPKVEKGYWYFSDRQGMTSDDRRILQRGAYNYTIAIYDADRDKLYYCEYDT